MYFPIFSFYIILLLMPARNVALRPLTCKEMQFLEVISVKLLLEPMYVGHFSPRYELSTKDDGEPQFFMASALICFLINKDSFTPFDRMDKFPLLRSIPIYTKITLSTSQAAQTHCKGAHQNLETIAPVY